MKNNAVRLKNHFGGKKYSRSCKAFKQKKGLGFFGLVFDRKTETVHHKELIRIVNRKEGEFYLFPFPLSKQDFHLSYHKSGEFHWAISREHHYPLFGEDDLKHAIRLFITIHTSYGYFGGFCFACHKKVVRKSLKTMLDILTGYIHIDMRSEEALNDLFKRKHVSQIIKPKIWLPNTLSDVASLSGVAIVELNDDPDKLHAVNISYESTPEGKPKKIINRCNLPKDENLSRDKNMGDFTVNVDPESIKATHALFMP